VARSLAFTAAVTAAITAAAWIGYGSHSATGTLAILGPLGAITVLAAHALAARGARIGGLRRRFAIVALLVVAQLAAAVALFAELMFVSAHDAFFTALVAFDAAALGVWAGGLLGRSAIGELERTRNNLIAAVSHDLRTPMTSLQLLAEAIDDDIVDSATRSEYVRRIGTHVRALSGLVDDLFELTRLQAGEIRWSMEQVRLDELVQETVEAMRAQADARAVAVRAELDPRLAPARANPEQLQRVLFNLIQNAIRHTPADGSVVVRAHASADGGIEIEVADTGEGIAAGDRERVFDAFFQGAGRAARTDGGAGLGLAISRAIAQAHGGVVAYARDGDVTRFELTLPREPGSPAPAGARA
jgi:signal transduction histidine kinase